MPQQPALDGIRALAVVIVILYHADLAWMHGGFLGVEVFFVVSGFLITSLMVDERLATGRVSLRRFWLRRARRLLPALFTMLFVVSAVVVMFADRHAATLRRDLLAAVAYVSNWAQILGDVPYFSSAEPILRHLWSLAVEEQWYLVWPVLLAVVLALVRGRQRVAAAVLLCAAVASAVWSAWLADSTDPVLRVAGRDVDRFNFIYLNTIGRASGLLLGAALALVWRPWARPEREAGRAGSARLLDGAALAALAGIVVLAVLSDASVLTDPVLYQRTMPIVSVLSAVAVAAAVDRRAAAVTRVFGWAPLVAIGRRSYGWYLWHWPVFVLLGARSEPWQLLPALALSIALAEACYRFVETPIRQGRVGAWWQRSAERGGQRRRHAVVAACAMAATLAGTALAVPLLAAEPVDVAAGQVDAVFDLGTTVEPASVEPASSPPASSPPASSPPASSPFASSTTAPAAATPLSASPPSGGADTGTSTSSSTTTSSSTSSSTSTTLPTLPRRLAVVGDSTAHSLAVNAPRGIEDFFAITDGSIDGCGVLDEGAVRSSRRGFGRSFADCSGWSQRWAKAAVRGDAEVALVVIGAWEVFDVEVDGQLIVYGTPESDERLLAGLREGLDALRFVGAYPVLLEVPCMRPQDVEGAGVPALPERGDDARVAHLNDLLRTIAAESDGTIGFVEGPDAWCTDPLIASSLEYRWDGVHVYDEGAELVFETIASSLLQIPL